MKSGGAIAALMAFQRRHARKENLMRQKAADVLGKIASEGKDLRAAVKPLTAKAPTEDATLQALRRNVGRVVMTPVKLIVIEANVRTILDTGTEEFEVLAEDIRRNGVRQNIAVELHEDGKGGYRLVLVFGQRRYLAAQKVGLEMIPALIVQAGSPADRTFLGLAENIFRAEMHPLDKAEGYQELIDEGWSAEALSEQFERGKRTMQAFLRLARFPAKAKAVIRSSPDHFTTRLLFNRFLGKKWESEAELAQALQQVIEGRRDNGDAPRKVISEEASRLEQFAAHQVGVACKAIGTAESGRLVITWKSREELDKLNELFQRNRSEG
jgi:ParB family transcriptional regulator, chromosome partitioning protein